MGDLIKLKTMWKRFLRCLTLHRKCPCCGEIGIRTETDNPIHPDGVPIFVRYWCVDCRRATDWLFSPIMDDAARNLGHDSAAAFFDKLQERGNA